MEILSNQKSKGGKNKTNNIPQKFIYFNMSALPLNEKKNSMFFPIGNIVENFKVGRERGRN